LGKTDGGPAPTESPRATDLKQRVSEAFFVFAAAAGVRIIQLGYLSNESAK
jgi:hypothetical protein